MKQTQLTWNCMFSNTTEAALKNFIPKMRHLAVEGQQNMAMASKRALLLNPDANKITNASEK